MNVDILEVREESQEPHHRQNLLLCRVCGAALKSEDTNVFYCPGLCFLPSPFSKHSSLGDYYLSPPTTCGKCQTL